MKFLLIWQNRALKSKTCTKNTPTTQLIGSSVEPRADYDMCRWKPPMWIILGSKIGFELCCFLLPSRLGFSFRFYYSLYFLGCKKIVLWKWVHHTILFGELKKWVCIVEINAIYCMHSWIFTHSLVSMSTWKSKKNSFFFWFLKCSR